MSISLDPKDESPHGRANPLERRVLLGAVFFTGISLVLIAYAALGLGVTVPTCLPNGEVFNHGSVTRLGARNYEIHFLAKMWGFEPSRVRVPVGSTLELCNKQGCDARIPNRRHQRQLNGVERDFECAGAF